MTPTFLLTVFLARSTLLPPLGVCKQIAEDARRMYAEQGIDMQITGYRKISRRLPIKYEQLQNSALKYSILRSHVRWKLKTKNRAYIMTGPAFLNGEQYIGGYAQLSCTANPPEAAMGNAEITNDLGQPRLKHSAVIMAHEVGHILSAGHDESLPATIMHPAGLPFVDSGQAQKFSERSLSRIRRCIEKKDSGTWGN